jgi:hypothetical protein
MFRVSSEGCLSSVGEVLGNCNRGVPGRSLVAGFFVAASVAAPVFAEPVPQFQRGLPVQVVPVYLEPGLPGFEFPRGGEESGGGGGGGGGDTTSGDLGGSGRNRLLAYEWGDEAMAAAEQLGIYGSALGSTCVLEGCQNVRGPGNGTISGWFQMSDGTFLDSINAALRENPSLRDQIVGGLTGKNDPVTQSIAAAQYLRQGAQLLADRGISNPTVLDTRSYYQFGPRYAAGVANANDSDNLRALLPTFSEETFRLNHISPTTTVGEWRATITRQLGSAAYQTVLR